MEDVIWLLGSEKEIMNSIKNKLLTLPEDTMVYPRTWYANNDRGRKRKL